MMNPTLAAMYNTHGAADQIQQETAKIAHLELFAKAAAAQHIDLASLDEGTVQALYSEFSTKLAAEGEEGPEHEASESTEEEGKEQAEGDDDSKEESDEGDDDGGDDKEAAARAEFAKQAEWQEKNAEADFLGRRMAHAFWDEYNEISKSAAAEKVAAGGAIVRAGKGAMATVPKAAKSGKGKVLKALGAGTAVGAGVGAGVAAAKKKEESKEASALTFDQVAAQGAVKIAQEAGFNADEAAERLNAVLVLGPGESEKVAQANGNYEAAVGLRGLELLERAGYNIDWSQVAD